MYSVLLTTWLAALPMAALPMAALPITGAAPPATRIVVLPSATVPDTLGVVTALRIQLARRATIEAGPTIEGTTTASRSAFAMTVADAQGATFAVWIDRHMGPKPPLYDYNVHVATRRSGAITTERYPMSGLPGPDTDRALALKVTGILDQKVQRSRERNQTPPKPGTPNRPPRAGASPNRVAPVRPWFEVGATIAAGDGSPAGQLGLDVAFGLARSHRIETAAYVSGHVDRGVSATSEVGELTTSEIGGDVGVQLLTRSGAVAVGADLRTGIRLIRARGETALGNAGTTWVAVPRVVGAIDGRVRLSPRIELRSALGAELVTRRRHFAVNDVPLVDLGRVRLLLQLSLVFSAR